jgi:Protein of unknown function (DUF2505)
MKFEYIHEFDASVETMARIMTHPEINRLMSERMSTIIGTETQSREEKGSSIERKVLYKPVPMIKSVGPVTVEPRWMEWVEASTFNVETGEGSFVNTPNVARIAAQMENRGTVRFIPTARGCKRVLSGELKVKVFMLGKIAERIIAKNAAKIVNEEAALLAALAASGEL